MKVSKSNKSGATEIQIKNTIIAYNSKQYQNINKIAHVFKVFYSTMKNCLLEISSQVQAREIQQNLSNVGKKILT